MVNRILDEGYQVIALSTCTGIDSYNKDDRMVALNLRQHISDPARYHVVMDETQRSGNGAKFSVPVNSPSVRACTLPLSR
ncbi:Colanic acid biosynthesis protein [Escherichia coli]|uniref:Colanic acid biosynthesis protein n=1 Tax=Escherichia coli TaxID=562 RepID=A0A377BBW6_ECOLX|nr:Colanic acid biosynthesis protein [Escherichia coli]